MALFSPPPRSSRLAAVLGDPPDWRVAPGWSPGAAAAAEPPTQPIPIAPAAGEAGAVEPAGSASARGQGGSRSRWRRLLPARWRASRFDPGRPGATALAAVALVAAGLAAVLVWSERPRVEPLAAAPSGSAGSGVAALGQPPDGADSAGPAEPRSGPAGADPGAVPRPPPAPLVVSVSGKVRQPGLVELPDGARVADALTAAGGALPGTDLSQLNLARRVGDGEQIAVGVPPAPDAAGATGPAAGGAGSPGAAGAQVGRIDLNSATAEQLDGLPGVGPVTAQRILEWRAQHGRFARLEQLREIDGIGERRFVQLRELVRV